MIADNCPACFAAPKERHRDLAFLGDSTTNPILLMGQLNIGLRMGLFEPTNPFRKKPSENSVLHPIVYQVGFPGSCYQNGFSLSIKLAIFVPKPAVKNGIPEVFVQHLMSKMSYHLKKILPYTLTLPQRMMITSIIFMQIVFHRIFLVENFDLFPPTWGFPS